MQWAVGLELFLLIDDPSRVFFTTDHPNGAPFTTYPEMFALLMSRDLRAEWIAKLPPAAMAVTTLSSITREYTFGEIATMTRAAPARLLGLADRGHLGAGAIADVAVYDDVQDRAQMFRSAALVFKDGDLVVRDGKVTHYRFGRALTVQPGYDAAIEAPHGRVLRHALRPSRRFPQGAGARDRRAPIRSDSCHAHADASRASRIDDTFAEAFGMRATALDHHGRQRALGAAGRRHHDGLCHVGDRLRLRGRASTAS